MLGQGGGLTGVRWRNGLLLIKTHITDGFSVVYALSGQTRFGTHNTRVMMYI